MHRAHCNVCELHTTASDSNAPVQLPGILTITHISSGSTSKVAVCERVRVDGQ